MSQVVLEARLAESGLQQSVDAYLNGKTGIQFSIDITIIGTEQTFDDLGREMSEHRLFLQKPYYVPEGTEYRNPQYLSMADSFENDHQVIASQFDQEEPSSLLSVGYKEDGDLENELCNIIDSSLWQGGVSHVEITKSVHAELMP